MLTFPYLFLKMLYSNALSARITIMLHLQLYMTVITHTELIIISLHIRSM